MSLNANLLEADYKTLLGLGRDERTICRPTDIVDIECTTMRRCAYDAKTGEVVCCSIVKSFYIGNLFTVPVQCVAVRPLTLVGDSEHMHFVRIVACVQCLISGSLHSICADEHGARGAWCAQKQV